MNRSLRIAALLLVALALAWTAWNVFASRRLAAAVERAHLGGEVASSSPIGLRPLPRAEHSDAGPTRRDLAVAAVALCGSEGKASPDAYAPLFDLLDRGAAIVALPDGFDAATIDPHALLRCGELVAAAARAKLDGGDPTAALARLRSGFALVDALRRHPSLAVQLARLRATETLCAAARPALSSDADVAALAPVAPHGAIATGVRGELDLLAENLGGGLSTDFSWDDVPARGAVGCVRFVPGALLRPYWRQALAEHVEATVDALALLDAADESALHALEERESALARDGLALTRILATPRAPMLRAELTACAQVEALKSPR